MIYIEPRGTAESAILVVLETTPGITASLAERIVEARARHGGFESGADLVVYADVPPDIIDDLDEFLLFRRGTFHQATQDDVSD